MRINLQNEFDVRILNSIGNTFAGIFRLFSGHRPMENNII